MHYAAQVTKNMTHFEFEDTDLIKLVLRYQGDTNIHTKLVSSTRFFTLVVNFSVNITIT